MQAATIRRGRRRRQLLLSGHKEPRDHRRHSCPRNMHREFVAPACLGLAARADRRTWSPQSAHALRHRFGPVPQAAPERRSGGAEERRSGGAEERRSGGAEERRSGGAEERRSGKSPLHSSGPGARGRLPSLRCDSPPITALAPPLSPLRSPTASIQDCGKRSSARRGRAARAASTAPAPRGPSSPPAARVGTRRRATGRPRPTARGRGCATPRRRVSAPAASRAMGLTLLGGLRGLYPGEGGGRRLRQVAHSRVDVPADRSWAMRGG